MSGSGCWPAAGRAGARGIPRGVCRGGRASGGRVSDVVNPRVDLPAALAGGEPFVLALNPKLDDWLPLLRYQLPNVSFEPVSDARGRLLLLAASIPASIPSAAERHGL